jgi:hypothetical protein
MIEKIYKSMIAGRVPALKGQGEATAILAACGALQVNKVHHFGLENGGYFYYFAVPSQSLSSNTEFKTELAAAIPGHKDHKGPGVYVNKIEGYSVAVVFDSNRFEYFCGAASSIEDLIAIEFGEGLEVFDVASSESCTLQSKFETDRQDGRSLGLLLAKISTAWLVLASCALIAVQVMSMFSKDAESDYSDTYKASAAKLVTTQPLANDMSKLEKVAAVAVKSGGWIEKYKLENNNETFTVSLPQWVSRDYVEALGSGVHTQLDSKTGQVIATKTNKATISNNAKKAQGEKS